MSIAELTIHFSLDRSEGIKLGTVQHAYFQAEYR